MNTLVMQESGLTRYTTLTVGRGRSLYLVEAMWIAIYIVSRSYRPHMVTDSGIPLDDAYKVATLRYPCTYKGCCAAPPKQRSPNVVFSQPRLNFRRLTALWKTVDTIVGLVAGWLGLP
jgi:hypothetical protein